MKCLATNCNEKTTHRIDGYAECGQDGGFVYQLYCEKHAKQIDCLCDALYWSNTVYGVDFFEKHIQKMTGLEYVTRITPTLSSPVQIGRAFEVKL